MARCYLVKIRERFLKVKDPKRIKVIRPESSVYVNFANKVRLYLFVLTRVNQLAEVLMAVAEDSAQVVVIYLRTVSCLTKMQLTRTMQIRYQKRISNKVGKYSKKNIN